MGVEKSFEAAPYKQVKRSKLSHLWLNVGKLILDVTKLSFASLVLGTIMKGDLPRSTLLIGRIIVSAAGAIAGIIVTTFNE
ncbi:MAG: hypothetical protein LBH42_07235 [Treponema sp.]|nr:hypothetical protein [Treponema sp.]